jgi:hypothetical protein
MGRRSYVDPRDDPAQLNVSWAVAVRILVGWRGDAPDLGSAGTASLVVGPMSPGDLDIVTGTRSADRLVPSPHRGPSDPGDL